MTTDDQERWMSLEARAEAITYIASSCDPRRGGRFEYLEVVLEDAGDDYLIAAGEIVALGNDMARADARDLMSLVTSLVSAGTPTLINNISNHLHWVRGGAVTLYELTDLMGALMGSRLLSQEVAYPHLQAHIDVMRGLDRSSISYGKDGSLLHLVHDYVDRCEDIIKLMNEDGITDTGLLREHLNNAAPALSNGLL